MDGTEHCPYIPNFIRTLTKTIQDLIGPMDLQTLKRIHHIEVGGSNRNKIQTQLKASMAEKSVVIHLNKLEFPLPKDALYQVWLKIGPVILEKVFFFISSLYFHSFVIIAP